jgi:hypothetical protein
MIYPTDPAKETEIVLQADKSAFKAKKVGVPTPMNKGANGKKSNSRSGSPAGPGSRMKKETDADQIDFNKKILHMSWHPFEDSIAIAATNNVSTTLYPLPPPTISLPRVNQLTWPNPLALCLLRTLSVARRFIAAVIGRIDVLTILNTKIETKEMYIESQGRRSYSELDFVSCPVSSFVEVWSRPSASPILAL